MRILLLGAGGQLGREITEHAAKREVELIGLDHTALDICDPAAVARAMEAQRPDVVINTAAYTAVDKAESEPELAARINAFAPGHIAERCARYRTPLIHVSTDYVFDGTKATPYVEQDPVAPLGVYGRTKAAGEAAVLDVVPDAVVLRPSVVFGPEDHFINLFGELAARSPVLPLIGGGLTLLQPVFVSDVAEAIARAVEGRITGGRVYELGGPEVLTFRAIIERLLAETGRRRRLLTVPFGLAALAARLTAWLPGAPLTPDQVELLKAGSVVSAAAIGEGRTFEALGIAPTSLGAVLPEYAVRFRPHGQYDRDGATA